MLSRRARLVLLTIGVVAVSGAAAFRIFAWPSLAFPDTEPRVIEARWAEVERRAGAFGKAQAASPQLVAAAEALAQWPEASAVMQPAPGHPPIDPNSIPPEGRRAIAALVQWAAEGGVIHDTCGVDARPVPFDLFRVGRLALRTSVAVDDPAFAAALRLGAALRQHGNLVGGLMGFHLADDAREIARIRGWEAGKLLAAHQPTREEIRAFIARDAVCTYSVIDSAFDTDCERHPYGSGKEVTAWYLVLSQARWCHRERVMYKDYWGQMNATADALPDLRALATALERVDGENLPSVTLRISHPLLADPVRDALDIVARYEALPGASAAARE